MTKQNDIKKLIEFLNHPLNSGETIINIFASLDRAIRRGEKQEQFVYIPGTRENKVLLVAHADTCWDQTCEAECNFPQTVLEHTIQIDGNTVRSTTADLGLGADDRAGCAMLWLLKDTGHSLLITNGEESSRLGSTWLMEAPENNDIKEEIQRHQFAVQFDRKNGRDFKCYSVGTDEFREYLTKKTGYTEPDIKSYTDIVTLCRDICGVNLSIGYQNEHTNEEKLLIDDWWDTLEICRKWLSEPDLPKFKRNV